MAANGLTQEQIVSRRVVSQIKASARIDIHTDSGQFFFLSDKKLAHDIALAVQDYFRRTGKDFRQNRT